MSEEQYCKIVSNCYDCGQDTEVYGPFDTEKDADEFNNYPEGSIIKMTCLTVKVVRITK